MDSPTGGHSASILLRLVPDKGGKLPEPAKFALREEGPADEPLSPQTPLSPLPCN